MAVTLTLRRRSVRELPHGRRGTACPSGLSARNLCATGSAQAALRPDQPLPLQPEYRTERLVRRQTGPVWHSTSVPRLLCFPYSFAASHVETERARYYTAIRSIRKEIVH